MTDSGSDKKTPAQRRRKRWGQNLKAALDDRDLKVRQFQQQLAVNGLDVSRQAIYWWLAGDVAPQAESQSVIAKVLEIPAHQLFPVDATEVAS